MMIDYITVKGLKCPFCEEETMEEIVFKGVTVYLCEECHCVGLDYRNDEDIDKLKECISLKKTNVKQVSGHVVYPDVHSTDVEECPLDITTVEGFLRFLITERPYENVENVFDLNYWLSFYGFMPIEAGELKED